MKNSKCISSKVKNKLKLCSSRREKPLCDKSESQTDDEFINGSLKYTRLTGSVGNLNSKSLILCCDSQQPFQYLPSPKWFAWFHVIAEKFYSFLILRCGLKLFHSKIYIMHAYGQTWRKIWVLSSQISKIFHVT